MESGSGDRAHGVGRVSYKRDCAAHQSPGQILRNRCADKVPSKQILVDGVTPRRWPVPSRESPKLSQDLVGDLVAAEGTRDYIAIEFPRSVEELRVARVKPGERRAAPTWMGVAVTAGYSKGHEPRSGRRVLTKFDIPAGEATEYLIFVDEAAPEQVAAVGRVWVLRHHESSNNRADTVGSDDKVGADLTFGASDHHVVAVLGHPDVHDTVARTDTDLGVLLEFPDQRGPHESPCCLLESAVKHRQGVGIRSGHQRKELSVDADPGAA